MLMLMIAFLTALSPSLASQQCEGGSCSSPARESFPQDETSFLQINSAVAVGLEVTKINSAVKLGTVAQDGTHTEKHKTGMASAWLVEAVIYLGGFLDEEGLWRTSGKRGAERPLVAQWKAGQVEESIPDGTPSGIVTSAITKMLQADPLFNMPLVTEVTNVVGTPEEMVTSMNTLLKQAPPNGLSPEKLSNLLLLLEHWNSVVDNESVNRMTLSAMSFCAAPLLVPPAAIVAVYDKNSQFTAHLGVMIAHPHDFF